jgi:gas vesicle protein
MSIEHRPEWSKELTGRLAWFLTGAVVGATVALLYAPESGKNTRKLITKTSRKGREAVAETSKDIVETGRDLFDRGRELMEEAGDLFDRGRKLVQG